MNAVDLLVAVARKALETQRDDGSFPPGHNGPYHHPETPVRATSHWILALARLHQFNVGLDVVRAIENATRYLNSPGARPFGATFHCRSAESKDKANGLIGQAWAIEALHAASRVLGTPAHDDTAAGVFLLHPFQERFGIWNRVEIDGSPFSVDSTFNHQLWFAACGCEIDGKHRVEIVRQVNRFLDKIPENMRLTGDGIVQHMMPPASGHGPWSRVARWVANKAVSKEREYRAIGYHAFNLHAFATLKAQVPRHEFWSSPAFDRAVNVVVSPWFKEAARDNSFGIPYNGLGFELPYVLSEFAPILRARGHDDDFLAGESAWWLQEQLARTFDVATLSFSQNCPDPVTLTARVCELARVKKEWLERIEISTVLGLD